MSIFSVIVFHQLFSIYGECSIKFEKDTDEYEDCMKTKDFCEKLFDDYLDKNQLLLKEYMALLEDSKNQEFLYKMHLIQKKIDEEIDMYISKEEQMDFISEYFRFYELLDDNEFGR